MKKIQIKTQKSEKYLAMRCSCGIMTASDLGCKGMIYPFGGLAIMPQMTACYYGMMKNGDYGRMASLPA